MDERNSQAQEPAKYFLYVNTKSLSNDVVETVVECLAGLYGDKLNVDLSAWDIERIRDRKPLFGFVFDRNEFKVGSLYSWDELAAYGKEDVSIHPVTGFREFFQELKTTYKYFRFPEVHG